MPTSTMRPVLLERKTTELFWALGYVIQVERELNGSLIPTGRVVVTFKGDDGKVGTVASFRGKEAAIAWALDGILGMGR